MDDLINLKEASNQSDGKPLLRYEKFNYQNSVVGVLKWVPFMNPYVIVPQIGQGDVLEKAQVQNPKSNDNTMQHTKGMSNIRITDEMNIHLQILRINIADRAFIKPSEIIEAFKRFALKYHPNRKGGQAEKYKIYQDSKDKLLDLIGIEELKKTLQRLEEQIESMDCPGKSKRDKETDLFQLLRNSVRSFVKHIPSNSSDGFLYNILTPKKSDQFEKQDDQVLPSIRESEVESANPGFEITDDMKNHLYTLAINIYGKTHVTKDEVNKSYRKLALKYHTDKGGDAAKFNAITEAKHALEKYMDADKNFDIHASLMATQNKIQTMQLSLKKQKGASCGLY